MPGGLVPAHSAFSAVSQVGFQRLEQHQGLEPPVRFWFTAATGSTTFRPTLGDSYLVADGEISPIRNESVAIQGYYGAFVIAADAASTVDAPATAQTESPDSPGPPVFVLPL